MLRLLNNNSLCVSTRSVVDLGVDLLQEAQLRVLREVELHAEVLHDFLSDLALVDRDVLDILAAIELDLEHAEGLFAGVVDDRQVLLRLVARRHGDGVAGRLLGSGLDRATGAGEPLLRCKPCAGVWPCVRRRLRWHVAFAEIHRVSGNNRREAGRRLHLVVRADLAVVLDRAR